MLKKPALDRISVNYSFMKLTIEVTLQTQITYFAAYSEL